MDRAEIAAAAASSLSPHHSFIHFSRYSSFDEQLSDDNDDDNSNEIDRYT